MGSACFRGYRGTNLDSIGSNGNIGEGYKATNNVDFSSHYNITPSLEATLEAINLTNSTSCNSPISPPNASK
jgi:hypothetical protein